MIFIKVLIGITTVKHFIRYVIALFIFSIFISACTSGSSSNSSSTPDTITVPMTYTLQGESMGLHMQIGVGNNLVYVGIDTGSVGLRVLESTLTDMTNITKTDIPLSYGYVDGVQLTGVVASAPIIIGGVSETINFMLIESVSCSESSPNCPKESFQSNGRAGLMGVNTSTGGTINGIWSPLGQLPGNLSSGFIVTGYVASPSMTIGLTSSNTNNFSYVNLESVAQPNSNPAPYQLWNPVISSGFSFPQPESTSNLTIQSESGLVLYDTGTTYYTVYGIPESQSGLFESNGQINTYQTLNTGNNFTWGFTIGNTGFVNAASKSAESLIITVNTGNIPYTQLDILYNLESGSIGFRQHNAITAIPQTTQMIFSDDYSCLLLPICSDGQSAGLDCVSNQAYQRCQSLQALNQSGVNLNDSNNLYIYMFQAQKSLLSIIWPLWMNVNNPTTLFAGFTMVYSPDPSALDNYIGWPVSNPSGLQQQAYESSSADTCLPYTNNSITSFSPWLSHCSAFAAWAESTVFSVQVPPSQPRPLLGYSWCGLANANNAELTLGVDGWESVSAYSTATESPVTAQILANMGCAVVANYYNSSGAGHIAVILPSTYQVAQVLQEGSNYPLNVLVTNTSTFQSLVSQVGPEEMQAGLYNFQHTVVYNGFFSELRTPDGFSSVVYFYTPASCPN